MFTPEQIEQISFSRATFGGYDMQSVDEFLEPLTEDYIKLYQENAMLKSKLRILVSKLEEYRKNEASIKDALTDTQQTCDTMVAEAEAKCAQMLAEASALAEENTKNADAIIAAENARVEDARRVAAAKIQELEDQMRACLQALERIRTANPPTQSTPVAEQKPVMFDFDSQPDSEAVDATVDEISSSVEALMGPADEPAPKAAPQHPISTTSRRFEDLQFGRNYNPTGK